MIIFHNPIDKEQIVDLRAAISQSDIFTPYKSFKISKGEKIAQILLKEHKTYLMGIDTQEERIGGFGSTDKK